jgi:small subunit ribosomal protein S20
MPTTKSAAKRLRQSVKRRQANRSRKSLLKTDAAVAAAALNRCFSELDKAAKGGAIHRNKSDRKKQRLAAKLAALQAKGAAAVTA